jgi:hypothetical protein
MQKKLIAGGAIAMVALALIGTGTIYAQSTTTAGESIVDRIAARFNLNKDDVQKVFDEQRDEKKAQRQQALEDKLNQLVKEGKLTEDQKTKLLAKLNERKDNWQDFENWLKENNIDMNALGLNFGKGMGAMGMHKGGFHHEQEE